MRFALIAVVFAAALTVPVVGAVALLVLLAFSRRERGLALPGPTAILGVVGLISSAVADDAAISLGVAIGQGAVLGAFLVFGSRFRRTDALAVGVGLAAGLVASFIVALNQVALNGASQAVVFSYHPNIASSQLLLGTFGVVTVVGIVERAWRPALGGSALLGIVAVVLTGSRSGLIGIAVGLLMLIVFYFVGPRARVTRWSVLAVALLSVAGIGLLAIPRYPTANPNLIINSGFDRGRLGWRVSEGSSLQVGPGPAGEAAVHLVRTLPGWQVLLATARPISVPEAEALTFGMDVLPDQAAVAGVIVRFEALDGDGRFLARAGRDTWVTGDEGAGGGRHYLPTEPAGTWQRVHIALPPLPAGARTLRAMIASDANELGAYGSVARLQLARTADASAYFAGPAPGIRDYADRYLGTVWSRLEALRDPLATSGGRVSNWLFGLELAAHRPLLGHGYGSSAGLWARFAPLYVAFPLNHAHNYYVQLLVEGGTLALTAFLAWVGALMMQLWRSRAPQARVLVAATLGLLVANIFDVSLAVLQVAGLFVVLMAFGVGVGESR